MKISVITVCFNSAATITAALASVAQQSHPDIEHVVVDGGSTDGTLTLLANWKEHAIKLITGPDRGIYDAMNKGVAACTGDAVGFLNSDDRLADANVLANIATAMEEGRSDCAQGDLVFVDPQSRRTTRYWKSDVFARDRFMRGWLPPHPTLYVRKSVFDQVGPFSLAYRVAADVEWMIRLFSRPHLRCVYVPGVIVEMDAGGVSNGSASSYLRANMEVWKACRALGLSATRFVLGKAARKIPQWLRRSTA